MCCPVQKLTVSRPAGVSARKAGPIARVITFCTNYHLALRHPNDQWGRFAKACTHKCKSMSNAWSMTALARITDSSRTSRHVRNVPEADIREFGSHLRGCWLILRTVLEPNPRTMRPIAKQVVPAIDRGLRCDPWGLARSGLPCCFLRS